MYGEVHEEFMEYHKEEAEKLLANGKALGREEGKAEGIDAEKIATARRMLEDKLDIALISKYTNLDTKTIESLR